MVVVADSTVLFHLNYQYIKMRRIIDEKGVKQLYITRINYLELLAGTSENGKAVARKFLQPFPVLEFDKKAAAIASGMAMRYRVGAKHSKDFLIASIAISNKIPR